EVIDDYEVEPLVAFLAPRLGPYFEDGYGGRVVDINLRAAEVVRRLDEAFELLVLYVPAPYVRVADDGLHREQPQHELLLRHFEREYADGPVRVKSGVRGDVETEGRLPEPGPRGHDDEVRRLK